MRKIYPANHLLVTYANLPKAPAGGSELVTPMRQGRVMTLDDAGERRSVPMRWGWPDRRPKANINIPRFMHAKSETIDVLPTFAESFRKRRGIVAVSGFNVGQEVTQKKVIRPRRDKWTHACSEHPVGPFPQPESCPWVA